jgi:hypothetical protein
MRHVMLKEYNGRIYDPIHTDDYGMDVLAYWFAHDVRDNTNGWIKWISEDSYEDTESNATWLEKYWSDEGTCEIIFGSLSDMAQTSRGKIYVPKEERTITILKGNVIDLLNSWERLLKTHPKQIMITEENGIYKMFEVQ